MSGWHLRVLVDKLGAVVDHIVDDDEEVLLDVGGQDSTEAFEDVGHSDEARETLEQLKVGILKRAVSTYYKHKDGTRSNADVVVSPVLQPGDPKPKTPQPGAVSPAANQDSAGLGVGLYFILVLGGVIGYGAWQYLQQQQAAQSA